MNHARFFGLFAFLAVGLVAGCSDEAESSSNGKNALGAQESNLDGGDAAADGGDAGKIDGSTGACTPLPAPPGSEPGAPLTGANPAAVYCSALGYASDLDGNCLFPDGTACNEWDFQRGACGGAFSFCGLHGGSVSSKTEDMGGWTATYALCTLPSGVTCKDSDFAASCTCE
jgi:putative hemolysin